MKSLRIAVFSWFLLAALPALTQEPYEAQSPLNDLNWVYGPTSVDITYRAALDLPDGYVYLDPDDTRILMELMENPGGQEEYYVAPESDNWFAVFEYDDTGYIEDNEQLDPDELLASLRYGNDLGNEERRRRGWEELDIVGWKYPPFYEADSQRLAWAILAESGGQQIVNYNTRVLGRTGVMSVVLVAAPELLDAAVSELKSTLTGFSYQSGQRYAEYRPGDKLAAYGLGALVAGGAAAAVASTGAGKALFKFLGIAVLGGFAAIGAFFRRVFGRRD